MYKMRYKLTAMSTFIRLFKSPIYTRLGRWTLSEDKRVIARKIDMANYDHCGTCPTMKKETTDDFDNSMDVSICALQSLHSYPDRTKLDIVDYKLDEK